MSEFRVVLDDLELAKGQEDAIEHEIQAVVLKHLASFDARGDRNAVILPGLRGIGTRGLVAIRADLGELRQLGALGKALEKSFPGG